MNNILIKGSPGTGKTVLSRAFAYYHCFQKLDVQDSFQQDLTKDRAEIEKFIDSSRCEFIQVHASMGYEDLVYGLEIKASGKMAMSYVEKRIKKLCDTAKTDTELYCIIFDDIGRTDAGKLLGNILYAMEYRNNPVELPNGKSLVIPENVVIIFTECTGMSEFKVDYALRRRLDYVYEIKSDKSILEKYYAHVNAKVKDSIIEIYESIIKFLDDNFSDDIKTDCRKYYPGHGMFIVDREGTPYYLWDIFKQKLIYLISPYVEQLYSAGIIKSNPKPLLNSLISTINTGVSGLNNISKIKKIMANSGTEVVPYSLSDTLNYYNSNIIPANCSDYKGVLESVIDAIVLNDVFSYDLATESLLMNIEVASVPSKTVPLVYASYLVNKNKAADYYYESARSGKSRVPHAYYSTNSPNVGRWVAQKDVAAYEYTYRDGSPSEVYLPLNGMRLHVFTIENVCKADNPAEIYGAVYRLVFYYLKTYEMNISMIMGRDPEYLYLDKLLKLEIQYLESLHNELRNVTPPPGVTRDKAKMDYFGKKLLNLHTLWNSLGTDIEVDEVKFNSLVDGTTMFTIDEYEDMYNITSSRLRIQVKGVVKMTNLKDYQKIMENIGVRQMIFQGPPGTSKTFESKKFVINQLDDSFVASCGDNPSQEQISAALESYKLTQADYENPSASSKMTTGGWDLVQFHPSYGYEDFIRGIEVSTTGSGMPSYDSVNRILGKIAEFAQIAEKANPDNPPKFYLVIDEINRANLATVFGELIYGLEYRDSKVSTPYEVEDKSVGSGAKTKDIVLGKNLFIIGTMNTADKSIDSIDYAIRRRFIFIDSPADRNVVKNCYQSISGKTDEESIELFLFDAVQALFDNELFFNDEYQKSDVKLGHTYFLRKNASNYADDMIEKFVFQIIPILREYVKDGILDTIDNLIDSEYSIADISGAGTREEKIKMVSANIMMLIKEFGNNTRTGMEINNEYVGNFVNDLIKELGY